MQADPIKERIKRAREAVEALLAASCDEALGRERAEVCRRLAEGALSELDALSRGLEPHGEKLPLVFAVDDEEESLLSIGTALGGTFETRLFSTATGLLEAARREDELPAAFILDRAMPGMSGDELARELKADARLKAVPILILTSSSGTERLLEGLELGALDYLVKPLPGRVLRAKVEALARTMAEAGAHGPASDRGQSGLEGGPEARALGLGLSGRESEVAALILEGLSNKEIGDRLSISLNTVANHVRNLYEKAGVRSRMELAKKLRL